MKPSVNPNEDLNSRHESKNTATNQAERIMVPNNTALELAELQEAITSNEHLNTFTPKDELPGVPTEYVTVADLQGQFPNISIQEAFVDNETGTTILIPQVDPLNPELFEYHVQTDGSLKKVPYDLDNAYGFNPEDAYLDTGFYV